MPESLTDSSQLFLVPAPAAAVASLCSAAASEFRSGVTVSPRAATGVMKMGTVFVWRCSYMGWHMWATAKSNMEVPIGKLAFVVILSFVNCLQSASGIRFVIDREECFSHSVPYEGDTVHVSFVVIKADTPWHYSDDGVDLVVKGPSGDQVHDSRDKTSDKFEFVVNKKGVHSFCFTNKSPYHETIDFDIHVGHFQYFDQHAKDEHFNPLLEQISKLEDALYNIQFEQHWLEAQTERQAIVNEGMSKRVIYKALTESAMLVAASLLQVYLLRRLFERKLGNVRV